MFFGRVREWWDEMTDAERECVLLEAVAMARASSPRAFMKGLVKKCLAGDVPSTVELKRLKNILWRGDLMSDGGIDKDTGVRITKVRTVGEAFSASPVTEKKVKKAKLDGTF